MDIAIKMIRTSYHANYRNFPVELTTVSITRFPPKGWTGLVNQLFAPDKDMLLNFKKGSVTEEEYRTAYIKYLNSLIPLHYRSKDEIIEELDGKLLLCFCGRKSFCHRKILTEWLGIGSVEL